MKIDLELLVMDWLRENFPEVDFRVTELDVQLTYEVRLLYLYGEAIGRLTDDTFIPWMQPGSMKEVSAWSAANPEFFDNLMRWLNDVAIPSVLTKKMNEMSADGSPDFPDC